MNIISFFHFNFSSGRRWWWFIRAILTHVFCIQEDQHIMLRWGLSHLWYYWQFRHDFQAGQQLLNVTTSGHLDIDHQFKQKECNSHKNKMGNKNRCSIILPTLNYLIFFILYTLWSKLSKTFNDYCISNNAKLAYLFLM